MAVPERKKDIRSVSPPTDSNHEPDPAGGVSPEPSAFQVNRMLWILLGVATIFLAAVQVYVQKFGDSVSVSTANVAEVSILDATSPVLPVLAVELALRWDTVPGAVQYRLRIHTLQGTPVVDPMLVWGEQWRPSAELLPGLTPGPYRWSVEAVDGADRILARSLPMDLEIE